MLYKRVVIGFRYPNLKPVSNAMQCNGHAKRIHHIYLSFNVALRSGHFLHKYVEYRPYDKGYRIVQFPDNCFVANKCFPLICFPFCLSSSKIPFLWITWSNLVSWVMHLLEYIKIAIWGWQTPRPPRPEMEPSRIMWNKGREIKWNRL